VLKVLQALKAL
jgi:hypothetical protein